MLCMSGPARTHAVYCYGKEPKHRAVILAYFAIDYMTTVSYPSAAIAFGNAERLRSNWQPKACDKKVLLIP